MKVKVLRRNFCPTFLYRCLRYFWPTLCKVKRRNLCATLSDDYLHASVLATINVATETWQTTFGCSQTFASDLLDKAIKYHVFLAFSFFFIAGSVLFYEKKSLFHCVPAVVGLLQKLSERLQKDYYFWYFWYLVFFFFFLSGSLL